MMAVPPPGELTDWMLERMAEQAAAGLKTEKDGTNPNASQLQLLSTD
jgi:hypothetical protein